MAVFKFLLFFLSLSEDMCIDFQRKNERERGEKHLMIASCTHRTGLGEQIAA